jgi:hypothetical protein
MNLRSSAARIVVIFLAAIGTLAVLAGLGMLFMHGAMMGGMPFHGAFSSMLGACRGMMGS